MINIVLCGGAGTRLWPLSRTMLPKQFVRMFDGKSLFQDTILRNQKVCSSSFIISNIEQYFLVVDQLEGISNHSSRFLLESTGRNTAPAIALACFALDSDDMVFVTPSDHLIKDKQAYNLAVTQAKQLAEQGNLVTFGMHPSYPETGFGYIESAGNDVLSFKEKPSVELAQSYIEQGNYYWNSGMFCFKAGVFLEELQKYSPKIYETSLSAYKLAMQTDNDHEIRIPLEAMRVIPSDSIDYAVMEKSDKVKVVPCDIGWSDLGSFDALYEELSDSEYRGDANNAILARSEHSLPPICVNSANNLIVTHGRQIALVDVDDLIVVDTSDAILISKKGSSQKVKEVVNQIKQQAPELAEVHRLVHRPWGTYEVLLSSEQYKMKRIVVKPGSKLSLQKHFHRNEHWVVVSGTATVIVGEKTYLVRPNESTYIQMGELHRLENQGRIDLVIVEVQVGEYTGEDDIVRIEDTYGR